MSDDLLEYRMTIIDVALLSQAFHQPEAARGGRSLLPRQSIRRIPTNKSLARRQPIANHFHRSDEARLVRRSMP
jgi:hypothetical protein